MRKLFSFTLAVVMALSMIIAAPVTVAAAPIVIKFAAQADSTTATKDSIEAFNKSQSDYVVEWVEMTNDSGQMKAQLINSLSVKSPEYDVLSMDVIWAGEFAAAGYLEPIDRRITTDKLKKSDYNAGSMTAGNYQGKQYTLPFFPDLGLLYFRSDIVHPAVASKLKSGDYTFEYLRRMAVNYKGQKGTTDGYVYQSRQYEGLVCNATEFTGGFKDLKAGLETMQQFTASEGTPADILNYDEGATDNSFSQGKSVFSRNWPYQYGVIMGQDSKVKPNQVDVAPLPKGSTVGGWLLGINKYSANKDGAWAFIKFLSGPEGQKIQATTGGHLPGYNPLLKDAEVLKANPMLTMPGFQKALANTISRPVSSNYGVLTDAIQLNVHKYLSGSQSIDTTVKAIEEALKK